MSVFAARPPSRGAFLANRTFRRFVIQAALALAVIWIGYELIANVSENLQSQRIATGFGFFDNTAGFGINQTLIPYAESDTYARVFLVGLLNTLLVAALGIVFATALGFSIGIARLSSNWLVARLAGGYVEIVRNLPLLFQILFWYLAVLGALPGPRQSIGLGWQTLLARLAQWFSGSGVLASVGQGLHETAAGIGPPSVFLNNRGLFVPRPVFAEGAGPVAIVFIVGVIASLALALWARRRRRAIGRTFPTLWATLGLVIAFPLTVLFATGVPISLEAPELRGFNFVGGVRVMPEFVALLVALSTYTAGFIAEIVRAGVLAVAPGQREAALTLGLRRGPMLRLIVIPQAMRLIIPPLTSQYVNLTKNSSLAIVIGYPDLVAVFAGTALNQTGQAVEIIAVTMAVYLLVSLLTSAAMNWYNARVRLVER